MMKSSDDCHVQLEFILATNRGRSFTKTKKRRKKLGSELLVGFVWFGDFLCAERARQLFHFTRV